MYPKTWHQCKLCPLLKKLNRLTQNNHQGAVAQMAPISFYDLDELVTAVKETKEQPLFLRS
jgi:23S rRNA (guanosine2251-2'-O)-methyltransferase